MVIDTIPQFDIPKQEIVLTLEDVKNAKNIWIGKDIKITDEALGFALVNKIPIHKDILKNIDQKAIIKVYEKNLKNAETVKNIKSKLGLSIEELKDLLK